MEEAVSLADLPGGGLNGNFAVVEFHDTCRPEERPFLNLLNQMVSFEDDRGVNPVFVDGWMALEDGRITAFDEEHFFPGCRAGCGARSGILGPCRVSQDLGALAARLSADRPTGRR